ncbi:hypothetical protein POTOM_013918 [Populus tomentosa]|uniref:Uncharacterized protein n=1 Tax=Populus tomentosa TaxID=118781 RepID=A0A8X8AAY1_POPTO|nr:hypothetical protein POTOM_013918 [Populus tomentosa]
MRINPNPRLSFIFLMIIILAISQLSSCRHLHIKTGDQNKQRAEAEVFTQLSWHFPAKASEGSSKDEIDDPVYGVSYRTIPNAASADCTKLVELSRYESLVLKLMSEICMETDQNDDLQYGMGP